MSEMRLARFNVANRNSFLIFTLLFNTLTWFYMIWGTISSLLEEIQKISQISVLIVAPIFFVAIVGSAVFGSIISGKFKAFTFFYFWVLLGILSSLLLACFNKINVINVSIISLFSGLSFGIGMPALLAFFADRTNIENRGRVAGLVFFVINLSAPLFAVSIKTFDLTMVSMISAAWRGLALILIFSLKPPARIMEIRKTFTFSSIFQDKAFTLYFVAWFLFCFIDNFEKLILGNFLEAGFYVSMLMVEAIIGSVFGLIGGWLCDFIGRKRVVIYGFVALGLAYAIVSISPSMFSWYFYFIVDGVSGGMLLMAFIFVLWGDLSQQGSREKYYAIGSAPYFLAPLIRVILAPSVAFPAYAAFSLASFFLFLAVLPLMYAPETLPEKKIELRRVKKYIEEAKKVKEKLE